MLGDPPQLQLFQLIQQQQPQQLQQQPQQLQQQQQQLTCELQEHQLSQQLPQHQQQQQHYQLLYHGTHPLFIQQMIESSDSVIDGPLADILVILKDGKVEVNSCLLAAISNNFRTALQGESTVIILPDLSYQNFFTFLKFLFDPGDLNQLDEGLKETVEYLNCNLMLPVPDFYQYLMNTSNTSSQTSNAANKIKQSINQTSGISNNSELMNEANTNLEEGQVFSPSNPVQQTVHERKTRKSKLKNKDLLRKDCTAELQLDEDTIQRLKEEETKGRYNYDYQISNQLICHSCSETGFSSIAAIVDHLESVHCWNHSLDHCVFCDIPFMSKPACIKHEKGKCKNIGYLCYICGCTQGKQDQLIQHLLQTHLRGIQRKCPHCGLEFLTLSTLENSQWNHPDNCESRSTTTSNKSGKKSRQICKQSCVNCGALHADIWKHKRNCIALNNDIKFVCHHCSKGFRRLGSLTKHFTMNGACKINAKNEHEYKGVLKSLENPEKGVSTCADCGLKYSTKKGRQTHARNCSAFTRFKCFACNKGMNALDGFHIHFSKYPGCRGAKENKDIVTELMARSAKPDFHVCHLCGAQYKTKETIDKHMLTHAETVNYFYCDQPECGKQFLTLKSLDLHLKNHSMPMVICSICGKQVKQGSLGLHMVLHTGKKVTCPVCGKLFQHRGVLNKHFTSCHTEKKRRKRKAVDSDLKTLSVSFLEPIMQTIQVDLNQTNSQPHQGQVEGQQGQDHVEVQGHEEGDELVMQHIVIPQPPPSIFMVKGEDQLKLENPGLPGSGRHLEPGPGRHLEHGSSRLDQRHHPRTGRQILVNNCGQLVLNGEDSHSGGQNVGQTGGHTEGQPGGHTGGHTKGPTAGHTGSQTGVLSGDQTGGYTGGHTGGETGGHSGGQTGGHSVINSSVTLDLNSILQAANINTENEY